MLLFADTETTGLKSDARIAQFAMRMEDAQRRVVGEFSSMVLPEGWTMPEETAAFHGLSQDRLLQYGMKLATIFGMFNAWCAKADVLIFHNKDFDLGRIRYEMSVTGLPLAMPTNVYCTMQESCEIVKCPPTERMIAVGRTGYKNTNLQEAHTFFTGAGFDGAHDAMSDVRACSRVYWGIQDMKNPPAEKVA